MIAKGKYSFSDNNLPIPADDEAREFLREHGVVEGIYYPVWQREEGGEEENEPTVKS